jgi:hypothetical protein
MNDNIVSSLIHPLPFVESGLVVGLWFIDLTGNGHYAFLFLQTRIVFVRWMALQVLPGALHQTWAADARAWSQSRGMTDWKRIRGYCRTDNSRISVVLILQYHALL